MGQLLFLTHRHGAESNAILFHQKLYCFLIADRALDMVKIPPDKTVQKYTVTRLIGPQCEKRRHSLDILCLYRLKL